MMIKNNNQSLDEVRDRLRRLFPAVYEQRQPPEGTGTDPMPQELEHLLAQPEIQAEDLFQSLAKVLIKCPDAPLRSWWSPVERLLVATGPDHLLVIAQRYNAAKLGLEHVTDSAIED